MGVRSRSKSKRRRAATISIGDGGGGGVDLISGLSDDLLLRILDLVPDAGDVVRTDALSRRWRGLWKGVAALRFDFNSSRRSAAASEWYIAFVNGALALRATAEQPASFEDLAICFDISEEETEELVPASVEAAQGWIRYAVQHEMKSFVLKLKLPCLSYYNINLDENEIEYPMMSLDEIGSYAKMESMRLTLSRTELRLPPSTVVFPSLTNLSLECIRVPARGVYLLSRFLSSACCPRLHKLRLCELSFELSNKEVILRIESDTVLELSIESMFEIQFLEIRTPSLQVLDIDDFFDLYGFGLTVSAPRLENLRFLIREPMHIDFHGQLSSVRSLNILMFSHGEGYDEDKNNVHIHLLQCCRLTRCLEVWFKIPKTKHQTIDLITGRIPLLPYVTHLTVLIELPELHSTGPGIACLLAQCSNIKYLSLQLRYMINEFILQSNPSEWSLLCGNDSCHWKSHEFLLAHLQEVEFKNLMGTDCEFQFIRSILTKATRIQKVTISFDRFRLPKGRKHAFKLMPPLDGGLWTRCEYAKLSYKWRRCL